MEPDVVSTMYFPCHLRPMLSRSCMKVSISRRVTLRSVTQSSQFAIRVRLSVAGRAVRGASAGRPAYSLA